MFSGSVASSGDWDKPAFESQLSPTDKLLAAVTMARQLAVLCNYSESIAHFEAAIGMLNSYVLIFRTSY